MKKVLLLILIMIPFLGVAQIKKSGYDQYKWGQLQEKTSGLINCNSKLSGSDFENCEIETKDSLFLDKYKYIFCNARFYKGKLAEIQFDIEHKDLADLISAITQEFGKPIVLEKNHQALDKENQSTGYQWSIGDTHLFIINDGYKVPAICILYSNSMRTSYPPNTLSLEKLIFE